MVFFCSREQKRRPLFTDQKITMDECRDCLLELCTTFCCCSGIDWFCLCRTLCEHIFALFMWLNIFLSHRWTCTAHRFDTDSSTPFGVLPDVSWTFAIILNCLHLHSMGVETQFSPHNKETAWKSFANESIYLSCAFHLSSTQSQSFALITLKCCVE